MALILTQLLLDAQEQGALTATTLAAPPAKGLRADLDRLRGTFGDVPEAVVVRALVAWSALFGLVSFELFGQFHNVIDANADFFATATRELAGFVGLPVGSTKRPRPPRAR